MILRIEATAPEQALIAGYGDGSTSKTRTFASCFRAWPERFGKRGVYFTVDPEGASLGPILREDRANLIKVGVDWNKDLYAQAVEVYNYDWRSEGITTIITDTMTVLGDGILKQITNSGKFSSKNIELSTAKGGEIKLPQQGDFLGNERLILNLLAIQHASGLNHLTLFHQAEVRPEPGAPGEPYGGPSVTGKALVRKLGNWYNTVLHFATRNKKGQALGARRETEYVCFTETHGIWTAKLRTPHPKNPIPEIIIDGDPINVWNEIKGALS